MRHHSRRNKRKITKSQKKTTKRNIDKRRRTKKIRGRKQQSRRTYKKQYGGNFNNEQIQAIRDAINAHQHIEPFTDEQIEEYMQKLNDLSQNWALHFDIFYENMIYYLSGEENRTFKQWVDDLYDQKKEEVETDEELMTDDEM
jgi:hypothetical protein